MSDADDDDMETDMDDTGNDSYNYYNEDYSANEEDVDAVPEGEKDIEAFDAKRLEKTQVQQLVADAVKDLSARLNCSASLAKLFLFLLHWDKETIFSRYSSNRQKFLEELRLRPPASAKPPVRLKQPCSVCLDPDTQNALDAAEESCQHAFCSSCWGVHFRVQMQSIRSIEIECMSDGCRVLMLEDFILRHLVKPTDDRAQYEEIVFKSLCRRNPALSRCPGPNCTAVYLTTETSERLNNSSLGRVECSLCNTKFCFRCCADYHAPTSCKDISMWLLKCRDESETLNYLRANTKDCPKCAAIIEKNGGCNHMSCTRCKHNFCWVCLGDWQAHNNSYECNRYRPAEATDGNVAREALLRYLFYFERWDNHSRSLAKEAEMRERIDKRVDELISAGDKGTWIDWRPVNDATAGLLRARYTLQYTYPHAYLLKDDTTKALFENSQAKLELEVENLSHMLEHFDFGDRAAIVAKAALVEKRRVILLQDFGKPIKSNETSNAQ